MRPSQPPGALLALAFVGGILLATFVPGLRDGLLGTVLAAGTSIIHPADGSTVHGARFTVVGEVLGFASEKTLTVTFTVEDEGGTRFQSEPVTVTTR